MVLRLSLRARTPSASARFKSTLASLFDELGTPGMILKSTSSRVYENLSLEDWIHDHVDLRDRRILLLWRNSPAVVIGRHQNPWQECDLPSMRRLGIPLARRRSGGGTVFHDLGNLNMTFFTSKKNYDRHRNLKVITSALKALDPDLDVTATDRYDILLNSHYKISGTAAKLGRSCAYHHCTLLCSVNRSVLSSVLKSKMSEVITSNATPSVPSPVKNLMELDPTLNTASIMQAVASHYSREFNLQGPVITVDPSHAELIPGITKMAQDLQAWDWIYGKTPKFSVCTSLELDGVSVRLEMDVRNGLVDRCSLGIPAEWLPPELVKELSLALAGSRFCPGEAAVLLAAFVRTRDMTVETAEKVHRLCDGVRSVM